MSLVPQARKRDKITPESTLLKNKSSIEYTFVRIVDRPDRKRDKIIPESTLLKNKSSIEYTFVRIVDRPDRKRGKLPPDRRDFKFQFNEHERPHDRSKIFSCLEGLKRD
jgi:hypothetical protein